MSLTLVVNGIPKQLIQDLNNVTWNYRIYYFHYYYQKLKIVSVSKPRFSNYGRIISHRIELCVSVLGTLFTCLVSFESSFP